MTRGRRTDQDQLIERLDLALQTKERLKRLLATLSGQQTVVEACGHLGVSERHFHALRVQFLQDAGRCLEGRRPGRPCRPSSGSDAQVAALRAELQQLRIDLQAARIREEMALVMPQLFQRSRSRKKNQRRRPSSRHRSSARRRGT